MLTEYENVAENVLFCKAVLAGEVPGEGGEGMMSYLKMATVEEKAMCIRLFFSKQSPLSHGDIVQDSLMKGSTFR